MMKARLAWLWMLGTVAAVAVFAETPLLIEVGDEELVSTLFMERPSVAVDSRNQPHFVCDNGGKTAFMKFHKVNGKWSGGVFAVGARGGRYDASRLYIGQIEIDALDRAWISCKFGIKEFGSMYGQGIWLFGPVSENPNPPERFFRFVSVYKGMGLVSIDHKYPREGVVLGTFGNWHRLNDSGQSLGSGSINAGPGGEKVRFRIASRAPKFANNTTPYPDGIWHTAMNGYSVSDGKYQNNLRHQAGLPPVTWSSYAVYPQQGNDLNHLGLGMDSVNPHLCYLGSVYNGQVCINIWNGESFLRTPGDLLVLARDASQEVRHGPAFAPAKHGGAFVFWSAGGRVKMTYLTPDGQSEPTRDIGSGRFPAAATDHDGNLHLVYAGNGIRYRKINVTAFAPVAPSGRITETRRPVFEWPDVSAAVYTLELTHDGALQLPVLATAPSWTPAEDLAVGVWSWRVKPGLPVEEYNWSSAASFIIPPAPPVSSAPDARLPDSPAAVSFAWKSDEPEAGRFYLQLFKGADQIGGWTAQADGKGTFSTDWPDPLETGIYSWRVRAVRPHANKSYKIFSEWSTPLAFQVAVPGTFTVTSPAPKSAFTAGRREIRLAWSESDGADSYAIQLLFNGRPILKAEGVTDTERLLARNFQPGYYSLVVRSVNAHGDGPVANPLSFTVNRLLSPARKQTLAGPPDAFVWTRQKTATRYRVKLARFDEAQGKFVVFRDRWVRQPAAGAPAWKPSYPFPPGLYRWTVTDYNGLLPGLTSVAPFAVPEPEPDP